MPNSNMLRIVAWACVVLAVGGMVLHFCHFSLAGGNLGRLETSAGLLAAITLAFAVMMDQMG